MKRRGIDYRRHRSEQVEDIDGVPYEYEFMGLWIGVVCIVTRAGQQRAQRD